MINYYTEAWVDEVCRRLLENQRFRATARKLNGTFVFRVLDGPGNADRETRWVFRNGEITEWTYNSRPAPWTELRTAPYESSWVMRATCPYAMMAELNRGEISPIRALASPRYQIEGRKTLLMQMMSALNQWNEIAASVEVRYDHAEA
jgi:hypothetical protein